MNLICGIKLNTHNLKQVSFFMHSPFLGIKECLRKIYNAIR
jgi:hypothetical protein